MVQVPTHQIPGVYHRRIGDIIVTALSDGYLDGTVDVLQNITSDEAMRMLNRSLGKRLIGFNKFRIGLCAYWTRIGSRSSSLKAASCSDVGWVCSVNQCTARIDTRMVLRVSVPRCAMRWVKLMTR
jgi:hypothetical protein